MHTRSRLSPTSRPRWRAARAAVCAAVFASIALPAGVSTPAVASVRSIEVRTGLPWRTISGETLTLDLYLPDGDAGSRPAVLLVHGGGWRGGDRSDVALEAGAIAERGGVAISIDYRLAPAHPYPAAVDDVIAALRWLRDDAQVRRYGIDASRIAVGGVSAGGQLAAMAGTLGRGSERVAAVVTWSGVFDFGALDFLDPAVLGCTPEHCPALAAVASPITHVGRGDAPMLLVTARHDRITPVAQSIDMARALRRVGVAHELVTVSGRGHATQLAAEAAVPSLEFLARIIGLARIEIP